MNDQVHDFVAVGLGPFNLGLACLTEPIEDLDGVFLEARDQFDWHPGMMLPDATLQVPFLADLVTMADPTSRYSFLSFLKQTGRLYAFYIRESFFPLRREYNLYCQWAAAQLPSVRFGQAVTSVSYADGVYAVTAGTGEVFRGRRLVLGTGTAPYVPPAVAELGFETGAARPPQPPAVEQGPVLHSADYLARKAELQESDSITVVGSGQSAAEIYADLLGGMDDQGYELTWVTRSPRFFPMEYTKLTLEMTSPEYTAYFQGLPAQTRAGLLAEQKSLYKGISSDVIDAIHDQLYTRQVHGGRDSTLLTSTELTGATWDGSAYVLDLHHTEQDEDYRLSTASLVLATGYRPGVPAFLDPVRDRISWGEDGRYAVSSTYAIDVEGDGIFVQNAEEHTHGFVAPDLGMGAYRNSVLIAAMLGREVYPVEKRVAFQEFGVPDRLKIAPQPPVVEEGALRLSRNPAPALTIGPLDVERHLPDLHRWVTHPRSVYWGMLDASPAEVAEEYSRIAADPHHHALLGRADGVPAFLVETYDPAHSELAGCPELRPGDLGMHVLVAPADQPVSGFTRAVFRRVMEHCFADPAVRRVVVEPDVRNERIARLNAESGFVIVRHIELAGKTAALSFCTREAFLQGGPA